MARSEISPCRERTAADITVIIPTFCRPEFLQRAIASCRAQEDIEPGQFEIVVVDNCPDGSARECVSRLEDEPGAVLHYIHEPERGISHARNTGLNSAGGRFAVFLDDDEEASPGWLHHLLRTRYEWDADIVLAPVIFESGGSPGDPDALLGDFYSCTLDAPTGSEIGSSILTPVWARGSGAFPRLASGNALLSLKHPAVRAARFDPRLARTGGEDTLFFNQLIADGARIVWCAEAIATERGTDERASSRYFAARAFRGGQITSWVPMLLRRSRPLLTLWSMGVGSAQIVLHGPLWAICAVRGSSRHLHHMGKFMLALGKVLWMPPFRRKAYGAVTVARESVE